jgi:hypothetical protein
VLRPAAAHRAFALRIWFSNQFTNLHRPDGRRWKAFFMSPDFDKYRALAKAEGDETAYTDDDLLPLWAEMEHLFALATQIDCPQVFAAQELNLRPQAPFSALDSQQHRQIKEIKE